ncbi:hypothetical protein FQN54_002397 [Arachnomyces sp. PD_36]|nr:hypothetical protein FQN54_002397 [Arachnomyces sp. PD_36]
MLDELEGSGLEAFITNPPPPLSYTKGRRFTVRSHHPPPPQRKVSNCCALTEEGDNERLKVPPLERCLLHPPSPGSPGNLEVEFEIVDEIRAGVYEPAQILVVRIIQAPPEFFKKLGSTTQIVAKFYDTLYWDHSDDGGDPFHYVEHQYTHEAATYERLTELQGKIVPIFYGSYSLELPIDHPSEASRSVRLIVMEQIHGSSLLQLKPEDSSQAQRQRIMKLLIDGESAIYTHDIVLGDLHPRNVLVEQDKDAAQQIRRVVHIDFGINMMSRSWWANSDLASEQRRLPGTFVTPLFRWLKLFGRELKFRMWVDWDYQRWLEAEYSHTLSAVTPEIRSEYCPEHMHHELDAKTRELYGIRSASK